MRHTNDTIWGLWKPNDTSKQIWNQLQNKLAQYGSKLDIVYDDPAYNVTEKYSQRYYWNQSATSFTTPLIIGLLVAAAIIAAVTIIVIRAKRRRQSSVINRR
jgi:ABC-type multidrug transport system permease subunit